MKKKMPILTEETPSKNSKNLRSKSQEALVLRVTQIIQNLREEFPEPVCALHHEGPYQLLVATVLSAQCTDERVNKVTPALFKEAPTPEAMKKLGIKKIEQLIKSINFFRNKAKNLYECACLLIEKHDSRVPQEMQSLVELPGVGRKTANVVLGNAFGVPSMVVDTHVMRLAARMGLTHREKNAEEIESRLCELIPREHWIDFSHLLILHGRKTCSARVTKCNECVVSVWCPSKSKAPDAWKDLK